MSFLAANPAGFLYLSPCLVERANAGLPTRNNGGGLCPSYGGHACANRTAIAANFFSQCADDNFALARICRYVSRLMLGHRFGAFPAPGGTRSSASRFHPSKPTPGLPGAPISAPLRGLGSSQNKFAIGGPKRRPNFFRAPPRKQTFGLGSRVHSLGFAQCDPSNNGNFNKRRHTIMYQNKVTLIGFVGSNPEVRTNDNRSLTTLSLATKSSYKKDGKYISHTEWHRCVVFGKLAEFAKTLTKGAHIQVEGELRGREYDSKKTDSKQRVWEIRVASILKLDRAEKAAPEDREHDDTPAEETAA
jgi:single-strand DNA-binding protein